MPPGVGGPACGPADPKGTLGLLLTQKGLRSRPQPCSLPVGSSPRPLHPAQQDLPPPTCRRRHPRGSPRPILCLLLTSILEKAFSALPWLRHEGLGDASHPAPQEGWE